MHCFLKFVYFAFHYPHGLTALPSSRTIPSIQFVFRRLCNNLVARKSRLLTPKESLGVITGGVTKAQGDAERLAVGAESFAYGPVARSSYTHPPSFAHASAVVY